MKAGDVFAARFKVLHVVTFDGGQGAVYAVEDLDTGKKRALKTLPPHLTGTDEARKSFENEVRSASRAGAGGEKVCSVAFRPRTPARPPSRSRRARASG